MHTHPTHASHTRIPMRHIPPTHIPCTQLLHLRVLQSVILSHSDPRHRTPDPAHPYRHPGVCTLIVRLISELARFIQVREASQLVQTVAKDQASLHERHTSLHERCMHCMPHVSRCGSAHASGRRRSLSSAQATGEPPRSTPRPAPSR